MKRPTDPPAVPSDVDCAVDLHRVVANNAPRPTPVEAIPEEYYKMYWKQFFIPPEAVPPGGLADILARDFGHIIQIQFNRAHEAFVTTVLPPETNLDAVAEYHIEKRRIAKTKSERPLKKNKTETEVRAKTPAVKPPSVPVNVKASPQAVSAQPPTQPVVTKLSKEQEESAGWLLRGLHMALSSDPKIGETESTNALREKLQAGFYEALQLPIILCTGQLIDPIELLQKGQGKCFSRILQDPLSSAVSVKALGENVVFPSIGSLTFNWQAQAEEPKTRPAPPGNEIPILFQQLRSLLTENLRIVDLALAKPNAKIPDLALWKKALETLCGQELTTRNILTGLV